MTDRLIRIKDYEQAADEKVSIGGIKWQRKWDVCIQCDSMEEAEALRARLAQPEPEPVAWRIRCTDPMRDWVLMYRHPKTEDQFSNMEIQPLYTAPPQPKTEQEPDILAIDEIYDLAIAAYVRGSDTSKALQLCFQSRYDKIQVSIGWNFNELEGFARQIESFLRKHLKQKIEQEPVAWINFCAATARETIDRHCHSELASIPLYTAPPQREWQGLTDEEVEGLWDSSFYDYVGITALRAITRAIEAKLKEKNT